MKNRTHRWRPLFLLAVFPLSAWAALSRIALPSGDELWLTVPATWDQKFDSSTKNMPPGVWMTPHQGPSFNVIISPLSGTPMGAAMADENKMRSIVALIGKNVLSQSVEMSIPVQNLTGPHVHGFYIFATDRAPKPNEWKYLTQGMINIDGAPFAFSILTNDGQEAVAKAAMDLIRDASYHSRKTT